MRLLLKGIHKVKKRLTSGGVNYHYYAWRGGPKLMGEPGSPEFIRAYQEAHAAEKRPVQVP
jgi:hypothetical protein